MWGGRHLEFMIHTKNLKFVKIHLIRFGFSQVSSSQEISIISFTKVSRIDGHVGLSIDTKSTIFIVDHVGKSLPCNNTITHQPIKGLNHHAEFPMYRKSKITLTTIQITLLLSLVPFAPDIYENKTLKCDKS